MDLGIVVLQTTGSSSSTSQFVAVSGAVLLILAWVLCIILIAVGVSTKRSRLVWSGVTAVGVMTIVTPLVYYVYETVRAGMFDASVWDFLVVAALSALGGGIITFGLAKLTSNRTQTENLAPRRA